MINGNKILLEKYPKFDKESRTPNGLDLRLGKVYELSEEYLSYGIYDDKKFIPTHIELMTEDLVRLNEDGTHKEGWILQPQRPYILEVDRQIKITKDSMQLYKPRSTLLRSGVNIYTAVGDSGYNGKLAFLCINHSNRPFTMEKGVRFAQLIDFQVQDNNIEYDGDFQETPTNEEEAEWDMQNRIQF